VQDVTGSGWGVAEGGTSTFACRVRAVGLEHGKERFGTAQTAAEQSYLGDVTEMTQHSVPRQQDGGALEERKVGHKKEEEEEPEHQSHVIRAAEERRVRGSSILDLAQQNGDKCAS
jgi:hypothetical protein